MLNFIERYAKLFKHRLDSEGLKFETTFSREQN